MTQYYCITCGRIFNELPFKTICTKCGGRILFKMRPRGLVKRVKAV